MADKVYKSILDTTTGAPLPFVLGLLALAFILVKIATASPNTPHHPPHHH